MINKMPSHVRSLITGPRLNYRQSSIMTTPVDKTSLPTSDVETVEPYSDAQPTLTNELSGSCKYGNDSESLSSVTKDPHSLLLKKATSTSSMNLESLLDNCGTLRQEDIIPRSTKSEPYATTSPSQQQNQEDDWNGQHCDHDRKDNMGHGDEEWVNDSKWNTLQFRLFDIITTTIHQELERHCQSITDDTYSEQHQHSLTTEESDDILCKNDRSTIYSTGAPSSLSVSHWLQEGHVALKKMIADQHQERTKTMGLLEQRIHVLEQQQQIQNCQKQDTQNEKTIYNALHERYMDLVTQHSHQLEKYSQLEQIHLSQSLAWKQHNQNTPHPLTTPVTSLPSPTQPPINDQQIIITGYPHKQSNDINTATPLDQQTHYIHRHAHYDVVSSSVLHHHPNLVTDTQYSKPYHHHSQQSVMLPTPNASPTATQLASPTHSPSNPTTTTTPTSNLFLAPHQQNQSLKMNSGYVEFMTECNGQHVLCRVKLPKDADAGKVTTTTTTSKNNKNTKSIQKHSSRQGYPNNHYYQPQYQNNINNNKNTKSRPQSTTYQRYQQQIQQKYQHQHRHHHTRQQNHMHEQHRYHLEHQSSSQQKLNHHHRHHHQHQHQHQQYQYQYQYQQCQNHRNPICTSQIVQ